MSRHFTREGGPLASVSRQTRLRFRHHHERLFPGHVQRKKGNEGQSMKQYVTGLALFLLLAVPAPVVAQDASDPADHGELFSRNGIYLAGGIALGEYLDVEDDLEDAFSSPGMSVSVEVKETVGADVRVGYRFHPHFACELQFQFLSLTDDIEVQGIKVLELETWALTGNLKGYVLTGRIQPFLAAGHG